jgi:hypothetical protein
MSDLREYVMVVTVGQERFIRPGSTIKSVSPPYNHPKLGFCVDITIIGPKEISAEQDGRAEIKT